MNIELDHVLLFVDLKISIILIDLKLKSTLSRKDARTEVAV